MTHRSIVSRLAGVALFIIILCCGCSTSSVKDISAEIIIPVDQTYEPFHLSLWNRVKIESLDLTIEFTTIIDNKLLLVGDSASKNAKVVLTLRHNDSERQVELSTESFPEVPYECAHTLDDLPTWVVCLEKLQRVSGTFEIVVSMKEEFLL